jgi:hypothetical protein
MPNLSDKFHQNVFGNSHLAIPVKHFSAISLEISGIFVEKKPKTQVPKNPNLELERFFKY